MRKILIGCLVLAVLFSTAVYAQTTAATAVSGYNAGSYEATVPSMKGDLTVKVTVDANAIANVEVIESVDTRVIADAAINTIPGKIIAGQTLAIDTVAGATVTSGAILSAAAKALQEAGGDMDSLKKGEQKAALENGPDEEADIVIVGAGGAGLSAAIQAAKDSGLKVVVVEKLAYIGGSTRVSGGAIWTCGTEYNKAAGIDFDGDSLIEFMERRSGMELNRPLLKAVADVIPDTFNYLIDNGMPVNVTPQEYGTGHPDSALLTFSPDNSSGGEGGAQISDFLAEHAAELGVDIRLNTKATGLKMQDDAVVGVYVTDLEKEYAINASKVILATGGFTRNEQIIKELAPGFTNNIPFTGAGSNGDGLEMIKDLDPVIVGDGMMGLKCLNHNLGYYGSIGGLCNHPGVFFNKEGVRFANEKVFYSEITYPLNQQTDKVVYGIVDSTSTRIEDLDRAVEMGLVFKADTLEGIADATGVNKDAFLASAEEYRANKASGQDDALFGVANEKMASIEEAPFYAVPIRPGFIGSIPGPQVNEKTELLNSKGEVVPNLYVCGEMMYGNIFSKWYPASGTGVGGAIYTGAVSGINARIALSK